MATSKKTPARKKKAKAATIPKLSSGCSGSTSPGYNVSALCDYVQNLTPKPADEQFINNSYVLKLQGSLTPIERIRLQYVIAKELECIGKEVYSTSNETLIFSNKRKYYED